MIKSVHIGEFPNGFNFNYIKFLANTPTNNWLVFYHGSGEGGPNDGSLLNDVLLNGYPRYANTGFEFPFNLWVPQGRQNPGQATPNFGDVCQSTIPVLQGFGAEKIVFAGLSQGCTKALDFLWQTSSDNRTLWNDGNKHLVCGVLALCGSKPGNQTYFNAALDKPVHAICGDADPGYAESNSTINKLKYAMTIGMRTAYTAIAVIPGGNHAAGWLQGGNPSNVAYGKPGYDFVNNIFNQTAVAPTTTVPYGAPFSI